MKAPFVNELQANQVVSAIFLVLHKDVRQKRTGEPFLSLTLGDKTGDLDAKMFDNVAEILDTFDRDHYVRVKGLVQVFQNRLQLTIHKLTRLADGDVDAADFFPSSARDSEEMFRELQDTIAKFSNPHLKSLLEAVFGDPQIAARFKRAPAAKTVHHAYLGGLLEHVLSMCSLGKAAAAHYKEIDEDLLLAGIMLHDIGKIHELNYDRSFRYSDDGQLLGHIVIGLRLVADKLREVEPFPPRLRTLLEHMILSHHGELEFGSPKVPMFPEALLLHHLDNLDSKMECMRWTVARDHLIEGNWTGYIAAMDRAALKKSRFLEERPDLVPAAVEAPKTPAAVRTPAARPDGSMFAEKLKNALKG